MEFAVEIKDKIRLIRFQRPHRKNAMTFSMYQNVAKAIEDANSDDETNFVVITGAGDYFSSGNDLGNFVNVTDEMTVEAVCGMIRNFVAAFINCRKPIIALVNGPALGIAVTVLALCDIVYASDRATFTCPFASLGLSPEGCSSYLFPKLMGYSKAAQLLYFNMEMSAQEAFTVGLVTKVFPNEEFEVQAWKDIKVWLELPIGSIIRSKEIVRSRELSALHEANNAECELLMKSIESADCLEAVVKYMTRKSKL